ALVAIVLYGAQKIWNKTMALDEIFHFLIILVIVSPYLQKAANIMVVRQKLLAVGQRLSEIIDQTPERPEALDDEVMERSLAFSQNLDEVKPADLTGAVEFRKVGFTYPGANRPALVDFNLQVKPGQMIAVVGSSGSGKSTLLYLLPRLFLPNAGEIYFDGQAAAEIPLSRLRAAMSLVSQESLLFPGTIRENILYGKLDASDEAVREAARMADIHDFIETREKGYETLVGERGLKLSGGQKQRLAIARAILRQPKILLLDEATSALDTESERAVQNALEGLVHRQSTFVVAHRLSTILKADLIVVLDQGRLVEQGTCDELLARGGIFKRLYDLQFS
ncbi:MAG: ATP-binding cassette domain-containing protein, partial [Spirochaetia bacterium]|nr:ATP-binding cassette domain-containing protein [Spirochaetia bacterium]